MRSPCRHRLAYGLGNVTQVGHGDEYLDTSIYQKDVASIINVGNQLRQRHVDYLLAEMNRMIADTRFVVGSVQ